MYRLATLFYICLNDSADHHVFVFFFFQAEDGIRDLVRSRGLGDVYKRQLVHLLVLCVVVDQVEHVHTAPRLAEALDTAQALFLSLIHI